MVLSSGKAFANVATATTDSVILAAQANKKIRVIAVVVIGGGAGNVTFNSKGSGAGTAISATFPLSANGGFTAGRNDRGWFETNSGEALTVTTTGTTTAVQVDYDLDTTVVA